MNRRDFLKSISVLSLGISSPLLAQRTPKQPNILFIFSDDHSLQTFGAYSSRMHEESLRNPLIVRWPKLTKPGTRCKEMVQNIDDAPTLLEAAGIKIPKEVQGKSLMPLLKGKTPKDWRKSILYTYYGKDIHAVISHRGVRTERYKLIEFYTKDEWEFYDLYKDPPEMNSEYNNPKYEKIIIGMKQELKKLMVHYQLG